MPLPLPWPRPPAPAWAGDLTSEDPPRAPGPGWVLPEGPPGPAAWPCEVPVIGIAAAEATGEVPAADDAVEARPGCRTWIETVDRSRNAIAPPESTMIGHRAARRVQPQTAPARPTPVLIRSVNSANASCAAGSRGQCPIRAVSRSLRSADRRCAAVMPDSR